LTGIRPEIPNYLNTAPASRSHLCGGTRFATPSRPAALISLEPFKPLSPETIKAQRANVIGAAAMCAISVNTQTLSQCNRVNPNPLAVNPRGDEREMKL
jgi:hypothetical protein